MQTARVDLSKIDSTYIFNVMQEDTDRQIRIELFDDGELYEVSGDTVSVWYEGSSGDAGNFSEGIVKEANALVITLDEHMTKNPGKYTLAVMLTRVGGNISTWNMVVNVSPLPGRSRSAAEEYFGAFSLTSLASDLNALNTRVDNIVANAGDTGNNAELVDIRLGYDGTTYPTAGDAVREQAKDSNNKLSIFNLTNDKFTIDGWIDYKHGDVVSDRPTGYVVTDYIPVVQGAYIYVTNPKIWFGAMGMAFYDHDKQYISGIDVNSFSGNTYGIFEVPSNAEYFRASSKKGNENAVVIFGVKSDLAGVKKEIDKKLDKKLGTNLLDPTKFRYGYFYHSNNNKLFGDGSIIMYGCSDYIPVNEKNIIASAEGNIQVGTKNAGLSSYIVFGDNKKAIRNYTGTESKNVKYTYQEGDAYVVFNYYCPRAVSADWADRACVLYGDEYKYERYTEYVPLLLVEDKVKSIEEELYIGSKAQLTLYDTSPVYSVLNNINKDRSYAQEYYIDHLIYNNSDLNKDVGFTSYMNDHIVISPPLLSEMNEDSKEEDLSLNIASRYFDVSGYASKTQTIRYVKESFGQDKFPKVLVIGDSVTEGYLADYQKRDNKFPNQYWAWVKWYFEMDRINDFASNPDKSNYLTIGVTRPYGTFSSFSIGDSSYKAYAVGKGGWSASDLFLPYFENEGNINPFYDPDSETFSLKYFVDNYKTLNDDGKTRLSVGSTAGPLVDDVTKWDVCTPTHVVINLNHNSSLSEYQTNITNVVNKIKQEYPNMIIILMSIDETGTYFPDKYPDHYVNYLLTNGLHDKNLSIYKWIRENLEDEENKIYVCSGNLIQPTVFSYPSIEMELSYSAGNASNLYNSKSDGGGPNWHPNNRAHSAWGYQLYALIKWTLKDL